MRRGRLVAASLVVCLAAAACSGDGDDEAGPSSSTSEVPTTAAPDYAAVSHAPVGGATTTTVALRPGGSKLVGTVVGPDGPVPGAQVGLTRLVGSASVTEVITAGPDGRYDSGPVLGGRYRVRAWLAPDLALVEPAVFFLDVPERTLDLKVSRHSGLVASTSVAPDPFDVDERVEVVARLGGRYVDDQGIVRTLRHVGVTARLVGDGSWTLESPNPVITSSSGDARWVLRCRSRGRHPLAVVVSDQDQVALEVPDCGLPPTTTTAAPEPPPSSQP